jgi:hypothetical protein
MAALAGAAIGWSIGRGGGAVFVVLMTVGIALLSIGAAFAIVRRKF